MATKVNKKVGLTDEPFSYCPGCTHGIAHKLIAEVLEELDIVDKTIGISPVGCAVLNYKFFNCDMQAASHGRAPAVATGIKRVRPNNIVFAYQGDGDLTSIGMGETIHAANRGENITIIFANNANFGMTGGQMSPTTLVGQKTTTSQAGRNTTDDGYPIKMCEIMKEIDGAVYVARVKLTDPASVMDAKNKIKKAFQLQKDNKGYAFIEILSSCPINWGKKPIDSLKWIDEEMVKQFPLGVFKDKSEGGKK
ncbi:MAG: thiamine pyrophosphate-dependent enzyme [Mycoplasmoidaceae bacterium]|nr:MAG: thiamine pyrophosphate-dependent enzyme [Mycoplasmoidaceae bacterium]